MTPPFIEDFDCETLAYDPAMHAARMHARRDCIAQLPPPENVARYLPTEALMALAAAVQVRDGYKLRDGVRESAMGAELFASGCVEARGPYLGAYGMKVRKVAMRILMEGSKP